jgi:hypothetical protein
MPNLQLGCQNKENGIRVNFRYDNNNVAAVQKVSITTT